MRKTGAHKFATLASRELEVSSMHCVGFGILRLRVHMRAHTKQPLASKFLMFIRRGNAVNCATAQQRASSEDHRSPMICTMLNIR